MNAHQTSRVIRRGIGLTACAVVLAAGAAAVTTAAAARPAPNPYAYLPKVPTFTLTSTNVKNGRPLAKPQYSGVFGVPGGKDRSPQLAWSGFPAKTKSFVVSMYDPEAPTGSGFWHWVVADIPVTTTSLRTGAGAPGGKLLPRGAFMIANDAGMRRYIGAAPPAGTGVHHYYLTVTALDVASLGLKPNVTPAFLGFNVTGHTLARATLIAPTPAPPGK